MRCLDGHTHSALLLTNGQDQDQKLEVGKENHNEDRPVVQIFFAQGTVISRRVFYEDGK